MTITPDFIANVTLYPAERTSNRVPIIGDRRGEDCFYICPCKFDPRDVNSWDCRILHGAEFLYPGETKQFGIAFFSAWMALAFRRANKFYLYELGVIGEATGHLQEVIATGAELFKDNIAQDRLGTIRNAGPRRRPMRRSS